MFTVSLNGIPIPIITYAIFMKIRIVHTLIGYMVSVLIHLECPTDTVRIRDLYDL